MIERKWNVLYIADNDSMFDSKSNVFTIGFNKVDQVSDEEEIFKLFSKNEYDMVIGDLSVDPEKVTLLKKIKEKKFEQTIFALMAEKDTDKLFKVANLGIHAFELNETQFDEALKTIAEFNPYEENKQK